MSFTVFLPIHQVNVRISLNKWKVRWTATVSQGLWMFCSTSNSWAISVWSKGELSNISFILCYNLLVQLQYNIPTSCWKSRFDCWNTNLLLVSAALAICSAVGTSRSYCTVSNSNLIYTFLYPTWSFQWPLTPTLIVFNLQQCHLDISVSLQNSWNEGHPDLDIPQLFYMTDYLLKQ